MEAIHRRNIDFCCAQETRGKGGNAKILLVEDIIGQCCN